MIVEPTSKISKFIATLLLVSLVTPLFFVAPKKAEAQLGGCGAAIATDLFGSVLSSGISSFLGGTVPVNDSVVRSKTTNLSNKEGWLDACMMAVLKATLSTMIQSITAWVQGGFNGSPSFARDLDTTWNSIVDGEIGSFLNNLTGVNLCDPANLSFLLRLSVSSGTVREKYECTFSEIGANFEAFSRDFESGGWVAYQQAFSPEVSPISFAFEAGSDLNGRIAQAKSNTQQELAWGRGFFASKDPVTGKVLTPGSTIENQLAESLGSNIRQFELADEFDELFAALLEQFTQELFTGVKGLFE